MHVKHGGGIPLIRQGFYLAGPFPSGRWRALYYFLECKCVGRKGKLFVSSNVTHCTCDVIRGHNVCEVSCALREAAHLQLVPGRTERGTGFN